MVELKPYEECYKESVRETCIITGPAAARDNKTVRAWLLASFCDYYIEQEPENCFVLADRNNEAMGYIICAENYKEFKKVYLKKYVKAARRQGGFYAGLRTAVAIIPLAFYAKKYPAHLHIDIRPYYQRQGWGRKLMDRLLDHLRQKKVKGLILIVGKSNKQAISFYKKYGFKEVSNFFGFVAMGVDLNDD
ncbi:MAG: GNAT family N-acetyltransferase [Clostridiales bacterium]|nr:GNAT family N-acetyltransferase [Clostridiales bacterium]